MHTDAHTDLCQTRVSNGEIPPIRALILNAGFLDFGKQSWTQDGLDVTFAANYLGHWLLTLLLLKNIDREAGRIVILGSQSHEYVLLILDIQQQVPAAVLRKSFAPRG